VVDVQTRDDAYRLRVAGTSGVVAGWELPRDEVVAATRTGESRRRVARVLMRCADDVVARVGDGRG
jgi:hypothetical protein